MALAPEQAEARTSALAHFRRPYREVMPDMFAAVSDLYGRYWGDFFHLAIFDNGRETWENALHRTHERYLGELRIEEAGRVLEMACGRGAFTELLSGRTAGHVLGIDISDGQLRHARRRQRPNLSFREHDIMEVHRLEGRFDAAVCLDAFCYVPNKRLA